MFRSTRTLSRNLQTYTGQASTEELHTDLNNMQNTGLYSIQQMFLQFLNAPTRCRRKNPTTKILSNGALMAI